ncbi:MAG: helix-turn-helix domain-containing protein [Algisphaera sp.]
MITHTKQTTPPPGPQEQQSAREAVAKLVTDSATFGKGGDGHLHITVKGTNDLIDLPPMMRNIIQDVLQHLAAGRGVQIVAIETDLTTNQAANILGVSRPYLIKLLDSNDIPHTKVNRHRRVKLDDLLTYRQAQQDARGRSLDEMYQASEELGLYE